MKKYLLSLLALGTVVVPAVAWGVTPFTEQRAQARWSIPFTCPDGSTASDGRLFIETDNFIDPGATAGPTAPLRVAFSGQCPDGTYSWGFLTQSAPTQFDATNLKSVVISTTTGTARDNRGGSHSISVSVSWTGTSALQTTVNTAGSKSKKRTGTATANIVFDGATLVNGASNFPFPAPFIEVDTEK